MTTQPTPETARDQNQSGELHLAHAGTPQVVLPEPVALSSNPEAEDHQNVFYFREPEEDSQDASDAFGPLLATPFQMSASMPPLHAATGQAPALPANRAVRSFPLMRVLILGAFIVIVLSTGALAVFAQAAPAPLAHATRPATAMTQATRQANQGNIATPTPAPDQIGANMWLSPQLPAGWTGAGLTAGDVLFAERTAVAFTDREMSLDFRSAGTRVHHDGTFTAALFILTPNAKMRFAQHDVRAINNVLFDTVQQEQRVQSVVNPQPQLVKFARQGQQQFAWLTVSFQLWQSKIGGTGKRTEGFDTDPVTHQPRIHHMMVLLLHIPQNRQGANPAMGGTGWLVSTYASDLPSSSTLDIVPPA